MQRRNRWIYLLMGCAQGITSLVWLLQADYVASFFSLLVTSLWFWNAYRPPHYCSRVAQWGLYGLAVVAVILIASNVYQLLA